MKPHKTTYPVRVYQNIEKKGNLGAGLRYPEDCDIKCIDRKTQWCRGRMRLMAGRKTSCESCVYYSYDEAYESYLCDINMDEDELIRLMSDRHYNCPYYRNGDDYAIVRKQM